jgi:hypothetical protein
VITGGGSHAVRVSVDVTPLEPLPEPVEGEPSAADVRP